MDGYVTNLTQESRDILTDWLWADNLLYHYFQEAHQLRVKELGEQKMFQAVATLRLLNED